MKVELTIKATVTDVVQWLNDDHEYAATVSHEGDHATRGILFREEEDKKESGRWVKKHLPATFVFTSDELVIDDDEYADLVNKDGSLDLVAFQDYIDRDEAGQWCIDAMNNDYNYCQGDILKPESLDFDAEVLEVQIVE